MKKYPVFFSAILGSLLLISPVFYGCTSTTKKPETTAAIPQLSEQNLEEIAKSITVKVMAGKSGGSGTIINKNGDVYTVLTNQHIVKIGTPYRIQTPDGNFYDAQLDENVNSKDKDLALLLFRSSADYQVAEFPENLEENEFFKALKEGDKLVAAGFPSEQNGLKIARGKIVLLPDKSLQGGYRLGYDNAIEKGMSGGPVLNNRGELIAINGRDAYPIFGDPFLFEDGSRPSEKDKNKMMAVSWGVGVPVLAKLAPSLVETKELTLKGIPDDVREIAKKITVRIDYGAENGSGVIIAKEGNNYYVLTAHHVAENKNKEVVTPDGKRYPVNESTVKSLYPQADLAVLQFSSSENYQVATLGDYSFDEKRYVFAYGWGKAEGKKAKRKFAPGLILSKEEGSIFAKDPGSLTYGYELVYTNITQGGMSGGPVLDTQGRVIGIHGRAEGNDIDRTQFGYSLGVPIKTFLADLKSGESKLKMKQQLSVETSIPAAVKEGDKFSIVLTQLFNVEAPQDKTKIKDWINYGNQLWRIGLHEEAVAAFDEAIKLNLKSYQAWYARGLALKDNQEYQKAFESFDEATKINPKFYQAWRGRGVLLSETLNKPEEALKSFDKAIDINNQDFTLHLFRGNVLRELKRNEDAVTAYTKAIELNPNHPWSYNNRGIARSNLKDYKGAIEDYDKAIKINPNDALAYYNRGTTRGDLKDYKGAIEDYDKAIKINPNYALAYNNWGNARRDLKDYKGAIEDYDKAIKINPNLALAYYNRGATRSDLKDYKGAIEDYDKAIKINPNLALAYNNRGNARRDLKDYQGAIEDFDKAIKINPNLALAYNNRGATRSDLKDYQGAIEDYDKAIKINPNDAEAYYNRGNARSDLKDYKGAIEDFDKAIKINPNLAQAYYNRGTTRVKLKDYKGAIEDFDKAIKINPNYAEAYNNRGLARRDLKDYQGAIEDFDKAIKINPNDAGAYYNRGLARRDLKDYQGAIEDFDKAIKINPNDADAYNNRGIARTLSGDRQGAIEDVQKAGELYRQQGDMDGYQTAQELLKLLQNQQ
jgi:tetratricopeptide (TPR) repeat protein